MTHEGVIVEAVKLADDRSGDVVVRLYESLGAGPRRRGRCRTR
ncbi:glycosyl hydrolase-related protein [Micromonospora sp. NPDC047074]